MTHRSARWLIILVLGLLCAAPAFAAPPDLIAPGVIAGIDRTNTYNLGPTGLRGWIWVDRNNKGDTGQITDPCRQILVTHCVAPANAALAVDDVILGAMAAASGTVPDFSSDCRKAFATAITDAEKTGAGTLRVKRWRAGAITDENIPLPILGNYSTTAPFSCPKSTLILDNVRNKMVAELLANSNYLTGGFGGSSNALALLSGVKPGDPNYDAVQTRLQTYARSLASAGPLSDSLPTWSWSYNLIFLSEYYLLTNDAQVVAGIQNFTLTLAQGQSIYGTYGHGPAAIRPDGSGRLCSTGYGPVNAAGGTAAIALVMGKKALVAAGQSIDPIIDAAIQRSSGFFAFFVNKGAIPYGEHEPVITSHASNSKDATPAVFFALQSGKATEAEYFARISIAGWIGREYGHTGQGLSYYWATLGALMGGPDAASEHLKPVRWHLDLSRRTDGSFAYDGQEQYGPGTTTGNTYLGEAEYGGMRANAMYLLTYSLPLQRLYITGKSANPAYTLNSTKIAAAVSAGSFCLDRTTKSVAQLFTYLGDYDPLVRNYASIELASRTLSGTDLTNLRNLLSSVDPNLRQSACQTLGIRQDSTALPTIVARLNDTDIWVRAKAAIAIRAYPSATASTHRDSMMTSFITNATDPNVIDWNDPLQMGNGKLSMAVFGHGVGDGTPGNDIAAYTINATKPTLLYPAVRAGLKQPDSYVRAGATQFCRQRLSVADVQAVYPEAVSVAEYDTLADRMWSGSCRADAITMLSALKISDAIPLTLAMLNSAPGFEWGEREPRIGALNALASYGEAARYTLPTLKAYLNQWSPTADEYSVLVNTINTIENAITAPVQAPGLCVANPQVVTTTGTTGITLTGASPRGAFTYLNVTQPAHGTITGTAPNLTYTPTGGYTGPDQFTFQTTDTLTTSTVATVGIIVGPSGNGLQGEYFNNANFTSFVLTRTDSQINFDWGTGSPNVSVGADTFSVRWSGVLLVPQSGNYTFSSLTSDGVRLYINGQLIIDRFVDQSTRWTDSNPVYLTAGQYADIYMEYYENTGSAVAKLKWIGPAFAGANGNFIPQAYLFDGSGMSNRPAYAFPQSLSTNQNTALPVALNGSGGTLTYTVLTQPTNGILSGSAPNLTYTPNTNFTGTDSFTFLVNNGTTNSLPATVSIGVQAGPLTSFTWASAVSGNWSDATKWTPSLPAAAGLPTYALNFTSAGTYTATHNLNNDFQLNQLNTTANVTLDGTQSVSFVANGGSLPQFNQNGGNTVTANHPLSLQAMTTLGGTGGGRVILNGVISGTGGLIKSNPGALQIGQLTNSYSGGTILNAGTVEMSPGSGSLTPALGSGTITFNQGAVLFVNRNNLANNMIFNGGTVTGGNSFSSVFSGSITLNGVAIFDFGTTGGFGITGNISGPGGFTYTGAFNAWSELPCSGTNTYTGPTTILSGTLSFPSINSVPPGPMILSEDSKLKLNFTGTRVIESFTLNGVLMPPGTYGSTTSPATTKNDTHFTGNGTITVLQPTTTSLNLTTGSSPANPGTSLTFTATVTGSTPTGNVQFYSGSTPLGTSTLSGSYQAILITNQLAVGSNNITARYIGNASNSPSTSSPVVVVINSAPAAAPEFLNATPADPSINLNWTASPGATHYYVKRSTTNGGPYTVIAYVTGTSYTDSAILNSVAYYYVVSALNGAGEGPNSIQATANIGSLTATTTTVSSSPVATGVYGSSVTFTATVTATNGTPTGTVTFRSGSNVIGTSTVSAGTASLVISTLAATTHAITASYAGSLDPSASSILSYQVTQKPITLSGVTAANKVYDGTTVATLSGGSLSGIVGSDTVTIVPGTATFANANTGTWAVTATAYSLGGTHAANYSLSAQPTVPNATITARPIHITGTKTYDATTAAPNGILTIANNVDGANLSLLGNGTLAGKDAGTQNIASIYATPIRVQSAKGNTGSNANTAISITLSSAPVSGNTLVAVISTRGTTAGRVSGITGCGVTWSRVSQATNANGTTTEIWCGPNVGTGTTSISITQASLRSAAVVMEYSGLLLPASFDVANNNTGNDAAPNTGTTTTTSQTHQLWIGGIGIVNSTPTLSAITNSFAAIDNAVTTSTAANNTRIYALERMVTSTGAATTGGTIATAQWAGAIATFKAAPSLTLTGSAAANYTLSGMTSSVTVNPKALTVTGLSASNRAYNGTTAASLTGTPALLAAQAAGAGNTSDGKPYTGDTISLGGSPTGGSFATKHVGTAKPVTGVTGLTLSGAHSGNYTLVPLASLAANVTQLPITVAAVTATKTYDNTTTASGTPTLTPALASGDTTTALSQSFQTTTAGTSNKTLIPAITIEDGNGGANYAVTLSNFTTGTINPKSITVAAVNATKTYDGTTTAPGTPTITPTLASGDTTSVLSQSFAIATAGISNKTIIPAITINDGNGGNNYAVTLANFTTGTINKATAIVTLDNLTQTFTNTPKSVSVTTTPLGLVNAVTYDGFASEPINAGTYAVVATVNDTNYAGSASGPLVIAKANQTITFAALDPVSYNSAPFALAATASSNLPVSYTSSNTSAATVSGNTVAVVGIGSTTITASQAGDTNYNPATSTPRTLTVSQQAPITLADSYLTSLDCASPTALMASSNFPSFLDGPLTGPSSLTITGNFGTGTTIGQLSLVNNSGNTFSGNINLKSGILRIAGSPFASNGGFVAPSMNSSDTITIHRAGTLTIDDNVTGGYTANRFGTSGDRPAVNLAGGAIILNGLNNASSSVQTFGALTVSSGQARIDVTRNSSGNPTLTFASLAISKGAVANFSNIALGTGTSDPRVTFTSAPPLTNGILAGAKVWAYDGGNGAFATYDVTNGVKVFTAYDVVSNDINTGTSSTTNFAMTVATTPVTLTTDRSVNSLNYRANGGTWSLGGYKLTIGSGMLLRNGTNTAVTIDTGTLTAGNGTDDIDLHIFTAQQNMVINAVIADNSASAVTLVKSHGNSLTVSGGANNTYTGGTYVIDGSLTTGNTASRTYLGTGKVVVDGSGNLTLGNVGATSNSSDDDYTVINGGKINISNNNHGSVDIFHIAANSIIAGASGSGTGLASLTRGTNITLASGAIIAHSALSAALNTSTGTIQNLGTNADLYYGLNANQTNASGSINIGNGTAFKGISTDRSGRNWEQGVINVASGTTSVDFQGHATHGTAAVLTLGNSGTAGAPVINFAGSGTVDINAIGSLTLNDDTATYGNTGSSQNVRFVATAGSTLTVTPATGMGSGTAIASAFINNGGNLIIGNTTALNGAVTVEAGGRLVASQAAGLTGTGGLIFNEGSILEITNATGFSGSQATAASVAAGTIVRLFNSAQPGTAAVTLDSLLGSKSPIYQLNGDVDVPEPSSLTTTMTLNKDAFGVGGIVTNGTASAFFRNNVNGQVTIGANGGVMAATTGTELQINENIEGTGVTLTFGTSAIIDGLPKLGQVALGSAAGSNNYTGENIINAGSVRQGYANVLGALTNQLTVNGGTMNMNGQALTVGNLTGTGGIINGGSTLTIGQGDNGGGNYQGSIQGTTALTKTGTNTITLSGTNTYSGTTAINAGTLFINGDQSSASGNVTVAASATLGGTGKLGGSATISANGKLEFSISTPAASHNPLDIVAGKTLTFSGASTLTIISSGGMAPGTYTLITGGNITGLAPATVNMPSGWSATARISSNNLLLDVFRPVDHFVVSSIASPQTVGTPITGITITAQDAANQTATSFTGTVTFGGTAGITGTSANFVAGVLSSVSVTPSVAGTNLTLTVDDGSGHTGTTSFSVQNLYDAWATANGATGEIGGNPDGDSLTNLQEFAFGTDPTSPSFAPLSYVPNGTTTPGVPILENTGTLQSPVFRAVFARRKDHLIAGITYTVSFSADLTAWTSAGTTPVKLSGVNADPMETVSIDFPATNVPLQAGGSAPPQFFRIAVSGN